MSTEKVNVIRIYDKPDGWVEYAVVKGVYFASAHTNTGRYSFGMLRAILRSLKDELVVIQLRYNYLVEFFGRHFKLKDMGNNYYVMERK